jgi:hypothetical protein
VEGERLGGTCLNRECIPKEALYRVAKEAISLKRKLWVEISLDFEKALDYTKERISLIRKKCGACGLQGVEGGEKSLSKGGQHYTCLRFKAEGTGCKPRGHTER